MKWFGESWGAPVHAGERGAAPKHSVRVPCLLDALGINVRGLFG